MEISMAALFFLLFASTFGSQASIIHGSEMREDFKRMGLRRPPIIHHGFHHPADCCFSYTPRKIRCTFMEDYFETSSGCSQPGVIFVTKKGQHVCANPRDSRVRDCMINLTLASLPKDLKTVKLA